MRAFRLRAPVAALFLLLAACEPSPSPDPEPVPVPDATIAAAPEPRTVAVALTVSAPAVIAPAFSEADLACLARTAYYEARGEGANGMAAVVHVVLNRTEAPAYPDDPCGVVEQSRNGRCQFSWACDGRSDEPRDLLSYERAKRIARAALEGALPDPTDGAVMFHATRVTPYWVAAAEKTAEIGSHAFYRLDE